MSSYINNGTSDGRWKARLVVKIQGCFGLSIQAKCSLFIMASSSFPILAISKYSPLPRWAHKIINYYTLKVVKKCCGCAMRMGVSDCPPYPILHLKAIHKVSQNFQILRFLKQSINKIYVPDGPMDCQCAHLAMVYNDLT